jgi:ElaB/YqjD/DUF883 family membrane-anchored ribosome-binding protein
MSNEKIIDQLKSNFDSLLRLSEQQLRNLPKEALEQLPNIREDFNTIKKAVQNRDTETLNKLSNKYANHTTK